LSLCYRGLSQKKHYDSLFRVALSSENDSIDSAINIYEFLHKDFSEIIDEKFKCRVLIRLATINHKKGKHSKAILYCNEAIKIVEDEKLLKEKVDVLMLSGAIYQKVGLTAQALSFLFESERLIDDDIDRLSSLYYYYSLVYASIGDKVMHKKYVEKSIELGEQVKQKENLIAAYSHMASSYGILDSINKYHDLAQDVVDSNPYLTFEKIALLNNRAMIKKAIGNFNESESLYKQAVLLAYDNGYIDFLSNLYNNYAYLKMTQGKYIEADSLLSMALNISKKQEDIDLLASVYDSYSDFHEKTGNFKKALEYKDSSIVKRNQYKKTQQLEHTMFLSNVFESEKKQKEILEQEGRLNRMKLLLLLSVVLVLMVFLVLMFYINRASRNKVRVEQLQKEKELNTANAIIQGQDSERKRIARDLHDGIGPRIASLRMYLDTTLPEGESSRETIEILNGIYSDIRGLSHRMLPVQIDEIGLIESLQNLFSNFRKSGTVSIHFETDIEERIDLDVETNIYYLLYELVFNAIKHSECNKILVNLYNDEDGIELSVEDNGKGFNYNEVKHGLGLKNIEFRVEYMGGKLIFDSQANEGASFMIEIPKKK
jgi:signal transduction histidine kinase